MKQPYIPLYTADYIKDTRKLTLELRGFWADLIVFSWDSSGVIEESLEDLARMVGVDKLLVNQCLKSLLEKGVCDVTFLPGDKVNIGVRWIIRHKAKSDKMTEIGKLGGNPNLKKVKQKVKHEEKPTAYPPFDNDNSIDSSNKTTTKSTKKKADVISNLIAPFDTAEFHQAWDTWLIFRKQIGKPYRSELSAQAGLKYLSKFTESEAIQMIAQSIQNQWQGLFPIKNDGQKSAITEERANAIISKFADVEQRRGK